MEKNKFDKLISEASPPTNRTILKKTGSGWVDVTPQPRKPANTFHGKPCKKGHNPKGIRRTSTRGCIECERQRSKRNYERNKALNKNPKYHQDSKFYYYVEGHYYNNQTHIADEFGISITTVSRRLESYDYYDWFKISKITV